MMMIILILFNHNVDCISYQNNKSLLNIKGGWNNNINNNNNNNSNQTTSNQSQSTLGSNDIKPTSGTPLAKGFWINTKFME